MIDKVIIYCDGGVRGNGKEKNVGAWAAVLQWKELEKTVSGGVKNTTNNRMEILAAINGLNSLKRTNLPVEVYTDSAYLCNCINKQWYKKWMNNGWMTSGKKPVTNRDLWIELIEIVEKLPFLQFIKVKGHSGVELNELADKLVNEEMDKMEVPS